MSFKNLFNPYQEHSCLPPSCQRAIRDVANYGGVTQPRTEALKSIKREFSGLPPDIIARAAPEIREIAKLHPIWHANSSPTPRAHFESISHKVKDLEANPPLAMLYLFHGEGRLRQAALHRVTSDMLSPFLFTAIVMRLNDWAQPVRHEAALCLARITASEDLTTIAPAIPLLCLQSKTWLRWEDARAAYDRIEATPEVAGFMATHLREGRQGALSRQFYTVLRNQAIDIHLPELVANAVTPAVRAAALSALLNGTTSWPIGQKRQWIDKTYGKYRLEAIWESRPVAQAENKAALALASAQDRAVIVRRVVASWLLRSGFPAPQAASILAEDASASIRQIIAIYQRKQAEHA